VENQELKDEDIVQLGKKDGVMTYPDSVWPIFELDIEDKTGIWTRLQTELQIMEYQNTLQKTSIEEIEDFLYVNSDIDFEMLFYEEEMPDFNFFKYNDRIYAYTHGKKPRSKKKIFARFYFELEDILKKD